MHSQFSWFRRIIIFQPVLVLLKCPKVSIFSFRTVKLKKNPPSPLYFFRISNTCQHTRENLFTQYNLHELRASVLVQGFFCCFLFFLKETVPWQFWKNTFQYWNKKSSPAAERKGRPLVATWRTHTGSYMHCGLPPCVCACARCLPPPIPVPRLTTMARRLWGSCPSQRSTDAPRKRQQRSAARRSGRKTRSDAGDAVGGRIGGTRPKKGKRLVRPQFIHSSYRLLRAKGEEEEEEENHSPPWKERPRGKWCFHARHTCSLLLPFLPNIKAKSCHATVFAIDIDIFFSPSDYGVFGWCALMSRF